jgi:hypothetical protein
VPRPPPPTGLAAAAAWWRELSPDDVGVVLAGGLGLALASGGLAFYLVRRRAALAAAATREPVATATAKLAPPSPRPMFAAPSSVPAPLARRGSFLDQQDFSALAPAARVPVGAVPAPPGMPLGSPDRHMDARIAVQ